MLRTFGEPPLFVEAVGQWPPAVVALHGWGRDRTDFRRALDGFDAASVDLPGFGMTPDPDEAWGTDRYAERVVALLEEVAGPVVLVGHSFGGRVAVRLAARRPDLVRSLVLTGAPIARLEGPRRSPALGYRVVRWAHRVGLVPERVMERARQKYGSADYAAAQGVMRSVLVRVLGEDYADDLARIDVSVTLLWGQHDADVPVAVAEAARDVLADARLVVVPDAGHGLPWQHPDALRDAIQKAVQS